ncbi:MAG TPA: hypothetical protein VOA87_07125 [Thermoanaerobaculia bacterium]|nr:hypothetical protein [Thermoanaerobaculia bacterium]
MSRSRLERLLLALLLALVAGVCLARGIGLLRDPHRLDAHDERAWFDWAYMRPDSAAIFARAAQSLIHDQVVCLLVPRGPRSAQWYRFMSNYYLLDQRIAVVRERGSGKRLPPQATVVVINWKGEVRVRNGSGADRGGGGDGGGRPR